MEFCNGGSLDSLLYAKGGFLTEEDAFFILMEIIKGILTMHENGYMHRDLKLENIMVHFPGLTYKELFDKSFSLEKYI